MNIQLIKDYAKDCLRAEFKKADWVQEINLIGKARNMGFDDVADEWEKDLKADNAFHKQVNSDYNDSISEGARL